MSIKPLNLPFVVKLEARCVVIFSMSCLLAAAVVGTPAVLSAAEEAVAGTAAAAADTLEGTVEAVVLAAATL